MWNIPPVELANGTRMQSDVDLSGFSCAGAFFGFCRWAVEPGHLITSFGSVRQGASPVVPPNACRGERRGVWGAQPPSTRLALVPVGEALAVLDRELRCG